MWLTKAHFSAYACAAHTHTSAITHTHTSAIICRSHFVPFWSVEAMNFNANGECETYTQIRVLIRTTGRWNNFSRVLSCSCSLHVWQFFYLVAGRQMTAQIFLLFFFIEVVFRFHFVLLIAEGQRIRWCFDMVSIYKIAEMCTSRDHYKMTCVWCVMYTGQPIVAWKWLCLTLDFATL